MDPRPSLKYILSRPVQPDKALRYSAVTVSGIDISLRELQPWNALPPMLVMLSLRVMASSDVQFLNATLPMDVTESGIVIEVMDSHPRNAT